MADTKTVSGVHYSPAMDEKTHEQTYRGFVRFVEIAPAWFCAGFWPSRSAVSARRG